ncbi:MAG: four helix bundle protein [Anaerolineae bacterium]|nr:four helix bundle protein [Anaerolineae bacterium]
MAEEVADGVWKEVITWGSFARDVVGQQMARAADSVGANIAESYGRYHYGDKLQFLYYARGSVFETKYWLNRALARGLMPPPITQKFANSLSDLAHKLNLFAGSIKQQRTGKQQSQIREETAPYATVSDLLLATFLEDDAPLFTDQEIAFLVVLSVHGEGEDWENDE